MRRASYHARAGTVHDGPPASDAPRMSTLDVSALPDRIRALYQAMTASSSRSRSARTSPRSPPSHRSSPAR